MNMTFIQKEQEKTQNRRRIRLFPLLLILLCAGIFIFCLSPSSHKQITLLSGQSVSISSLSGNNVFYQIKTNGCLAWNNDSRTITGTSDGTAEITCLKGFRRIHYTVQVCTPAAQKTTKTSLPLGYSGSLDPENEALPHTWTSSDISIVSISPDGTLSCLSPGVCQITETINDYLTYRYTVTVLKPQLNYTEYSLYRNDSVQLTLENCEYEPVWKSVDPSIAYVSSDGTVTAGELGDTTIFLTANSQTYHCRIHVEKDPTTVELIDMLLDDEPFLLRVASAVETPVFTSDDPTVAAIDENGLITPQGEGITIIHTRIRNHQLETRVQVRAYNPQADLDENNYTNVSGVSNAVKIFIGCGDYYNDRLLSGIRKGEKWVYSNSNKYVAQRISFDAMTHAKHKGGNCTSIANWAFLDMGIIPKGVCFYGDENGNIKHYNAGDTSCKKYLDAACDIINAHDKTFQQLFKEGKIQAGDIMTSRYHTFIYRGGKTFFCCGHDAKWHREKNAYTEDSHKAVFDNWILPMDDCSNLNAKVGYIIRIKDTYEPKNFRNLEGKITANPLFIQKY